MFINLCLTSYLSYSDFSADIQVNLNVNEKMTAVLDRLDKYRAVEDSLRLESAEQIHKIQKQQEDTLALVAKHIDEVRT